MRLLITNDDGIYSPGLAALAAAARRFGDVRIVAPDVEQSSMSHAITSSRPLHYRPTKIDGFTAFRVNGTPADCVALGAYHWGEVDAVLSGINLGPNLGSAIWHSGTLAAAKQAALLGIQGIAFSVPVPRPDPGPEEDELELEPVEPEFGRLLPYLDRVLELVLGDPDLPLVNVNFPPEPRGLCWARQAVQHYDGRVVPGQDPMGRRHFWFTVTRIEEEEEGSDRWAVKRGYVSITPLRLDLTHHDRLEHAKARHPLD